MEGETGTRASPANILEKRLSKCLEGKAIAIDMGTPIAYDKEGDSSQSIDLRYLVQVYNQINPNETINYKDIKREDLEKYIVGR